jgi:hypothetical protein
MTDEEYFVYDDKQNPHCFREAYLNTALLVSGEADAGCVLLNPQVVTPAGEWETWFLANWIAGARRYRSFHEWMVKERKSCRELFGAGK